MKIVMEGGAGAAWRMAELVDNTRNRKGVHTQMRDRAHEIVSRMFKNEGNEAFQWPPLRPRYAKRKARIVGRATQMLVWSGRLRQSLEYPGAPDGVSFADNEKAVVGTLVPYAVYHQSDKPRTVIPRRPFFFYSVKEIEELKGIFFRWVHKNIHKPAPAPTTSTGKAGWPHA
jgi:phage gpG-like protein